MSDQPNESPKTDEVQADSNEGAADSTDAENTEASVEANAEETNDVTEGESLGVTPELQALQDEIVGLKEQALRSHAEAQNARRRAEQDVEKARKFALEKFVSELLPVADNLERAIAAGDKEDEGQKAVLEGVELTYKSLLDTLKKFKVEPIDPEGEPFDPELHQAMSMVPSPDVEPNTVLNVFQKGYTLYGRLVRPAMVVVSSASS